MFLENDLHPSLSLDGDWQFRLGDAAPRTIRVPSAWEATQADKLTEGPARFSHDFRVPNAPLGAGERWLLEFDGVSFAATVFVNGEWAGEHTGLWSQWQLDVSAQVRPGRNHIDIDVWKPGETRHKLRESLAGFLPDVCNTFGGIWQSVRLRRIVYALADMRVHASATGEVRVWGVVAGPKLRGLSVRIQVDGANGGTPARVNADGSFDLKIAISQPKRWSPAKPLHHTLQIDVLDAHGSVVARAKRRVGLRDISTRGDTTLLNATPFHLRGVLDWGWHPHKLCPTPTRTEVRRMFADARALGFNLFKLCLFVPDEPTFEVADEQGMLLWLELPMWLPVVTRESKTLALREYDAILRRVHHHPSIVIVSLGCELDSAVHADFLADLRAIVHKWLPNALLCDNSGSSEAYAGAAPAQGDFNDYHFYADAHYFQPLVKHFDRRYQTRKPWIYGEFCDADTMRNWTPVRDAFWVTGPVTMQRDELVWARESAARLKAAHVRDGGAALTRIGRAQGTALRKHIFELTRRERATGGYVVTSWRDTPIATSGVTDDAGVSKFTPDAWQQFNAERVLLLDRERRRVWQHGGDRPVYRDPCCWFTDEPLEFHLALSNGGAAVDGAVVTWQFCADARQVATGNVPVAHVAAGDVAELDTITVPALGVRQPANLRFEAKLTVRRKPITQNSWPVLLLPRVQVDGANGAPWHSCIDDALLADVALGNRANVWLREPDGEIAHNLPFWREAIHVFMPRFERMAGVGKLTHADMRFYGIASDIAIDATALQKRCATFGPTFVPLWRRFDARRMVWHEYVCDVRIGLGTLRVATLKFCGGLGDQPNTFATNPIGAWLWDQCRS